MAVIQTRFEREALELSYQILNGYRIAHGSDVPAVIEDAYIALQKLLWPYWDDHEKSIKAHDVDCTSSIANKSLYEAYFNRYER